MFELSKRFRFDAAHTLERTVETDSSRRIHGHSYQAEIVIRGTPDSSTGMVLDLGILDRLLSDTREALDHHMLNEIPDLGPPTIESLCSWIWRRLTPIVPGLYRVTVSRSSHDDSCSYYGPD